MKVFFTLIISICQIFIAIIPIKYKVSDNRNRFPQDWTKAGKILLALCVVSIICTCFLYSISENEQTTAQNTLDEKLKSRDSINELKRDTLIAFYSNKVDSSYLKSQELFVDVTARYGLHYDSLNKRLEKKIDTASKELLPDLIFESITVDSIRGYQYFINTGIKCEQAPSRDIDCKIEIFIEDALGKIHQVNYVSSNKMTYKSMSKGQLIQRPNLLTSNNGKLKIIYIHLSGEYSNVRRSIKQTVNEWRLYDLQIASNNFKIPFPEKQKELNLLLNK